MTNCKVSLVVLLILCTGAFACTQPQTNQPKTGASPTTEVAKTAASPQPPCPADASWITAPNPPTEIGGPNVPLSSETNCQFYQFAYQWFFDMVQPAAGASGERKFETLRVYQPNQTNQCNAKPLTGRANTAKAIFVRTPKPKDDDVEPVTPVGILEADGNPLYDQNGNAVFFYILYDPKECQANWQTGFLPNTVEVKTAWRVLNAPDPAYLTMSANIQGFPKNPVTLGLVGFHLVINTKLHPEFVWATFEHVNNAPDCTNPQNPPAAGWSFLSPDCATCLKQNGLNGCPQCKFNQPASGTPGLTGPANNVCRVYPDGTDPGSMTGGNNNDTNRFNIDTLNSQINAMLSQLPSDSPMSVWKNYTLVAGLWTNGGVASGNAANQRGSLEAANLTLETFQQQQGNNCFSCHIYDPQNPLDVSNIIQNLLPTPTPTPANRP